MKTIITHFYNEEYLLPWWLEHHKKYFDFGILIDYGSTDRSVEICKKICPHWQIFPSAHGKFDASDCDREVEFYERQIPGWRISLTVTEFLVGNLSKLMHEEENRTQWLIPGVIFASYNPAGKFSREKELWDQCSTGVPYTVSSAARLCRSLHNFKDISYSPGRHFHPLNTEDAMIFKFSNCLIGEEMIKRRLQIQHRVSERDKISGCSDQHVYASHGGLTHQTLPLYYKEKIESLGPIDCSDLINKIRF